MSKSTDPMKIGANQTTSLMGKELLTVTEIIGLKYKTIIFPTISNPIFRDTYLYSDLYPDYVDLGAIERETKVLKRITSNYYTVEDLRGEYEKLDDSKIKRMTMDVEKNFERAINKSINKEVNIRKKRG